MTPQATPLRPSRVLGAGLLQAVVVSAGLAAFALGPAGELQAQAAQTGNRSAGEPPAARSPGVSGAQTPWEDLQVASPEITPRGAFLRSLVVPGWGHLAADSPGRASFYVAVQGGTWWMLGKSLLRQRSASRFREAELEFVREELQAAGVQNADSLRVQSVSDPRVVRWDELVDIRGEQVEDWVALAIFLSLLGATDALVSAHMADYPEPLTFSVAPSPGTLFGDRRWDLGVRLSLGGSGNPGLRTPSRGFRGAGARP